MRRRPFFAVEHPIEVSEDLRNKLLLLASAAVLGVVLLALTGLIFNLSPLKDWGPNIVMNFKIVSAFVLLALGFFLAVLPRFYRNPWTRAIAFLGLLGSLSIGIYGLITYFTVTAHMSMDVFVNQDALVRGHMGLYTNLGFILASMISLCNLLVPRTRQWSLWSVQLPGLLLINLGATAFLHKLGMVTFFHLLISLPSSFAFLLYGFALILSRGAETPIISTFMSRSPRVRLFTFMLCCSWLGFVLWQALAWANYLATVPSNINSARSAIVTIDLLEITFASMLMGFGFNILGALEQYGQLLLRLRETFESYTMLAAMLSHDLKAPIETEINAIEMVLNSPLGDGISDKARRMLSSVNENNRFELELVLNLVDLMRYEMKQEKFSPVPVEINQMLREIQREMAPLAMHKGQGLEFILSPEETQTIFGDPVGLKRVFSNLINNAIKHLSAGHHIQVSVDCREADCLFWVKDNGSGIPAEVQGRLFESFMAGEGASRMPSSSGLGLYISRQIVRRHGGKIWVESVQDQGSTFYFTLPRRFPMSDEALSNSGNSHMRTTGTAMEVLF